MNNTAVRISLSIFLFALALGISAPASRAATVCPTIPSVKWWDDTDREKMIRYVDARHGGDWDAYIEKWQKHLDRVRAIHTRGGAVISKKLGIRVEGRQLYEYIKAVEQRLAITRCLADQEMETAAKKLEGLETASGGEDPLPETVR